MKDKNKFIASGILEMYVLGATTDLENAEVNAMAAVYPEIRAEIDAIANALQAYSKARVAPLSRTIKPMVIATINYQERLSKGEQPGSPPLLNEHSTIAHFSTWLNREDLQVNEVEDIELRIIGHEPGVMTGILWIKESAPYEIHDNEIEKFLIIEGSCDIVTDRGTLSLSPGDYYAVPLHLGHSVKITSKIPCKAILQRVAA